MDLRENLGKNKNGPRPHVFPSTQVLDCKYLSKYLCFWSANTNKGLFNFCYTLSLLN